MSLSMDKCLEDGICMLKVTSKHVLSLSLHRERKQALTGCSTLLLMIDKSSSLNDDLPFSLESGNLPPQIPSESFCVSHRKL